MKKNYNIVTANQAVAHIAYKTNEVCAIYPITPATEMAELVEQWSANEQHNIFSNVPSVFQMQSEAGVSGAMHGALQTGSLATTFTASQGLLLMIPNMYKIAGELTPNVIHVATRTIATHALSIFGDHSDIMAARQTGYAFLGSASVQEAQDFALIAQASTLDSQIPFVHFFDGFRTSHETSKIEVLSDAIIKSMINPSNVNTHQNRALNPNNPVIRGTAQSSDVYFQNCEARNSYYNSCPELVQKNMDAFAKLTGRAYKIFDYVGDNYAEHVIISMASSTETIEETINHLNMNGAKIGLIKVRLFRPFSTKHLIEALPFTCKSIAVLDRTKEAGSSGEPLYLDVVQSLMSVINNHKFNRFPKVIGGRYGLSSKEFTPNMVNAIIKNLKQENPKQNFTIGINDDVTNLSLEFSETININSNMYQAVFYHKKHETNTNGFSDLVKLIGNTNNNYVQSYTELDYKKSNSRSVAHLRINESPIKAPYLIEQADFIVCENADFIETDNAINTLQTKGTLLVNTSQTSKAFWQALSAKSKHQIIEKKIALHIANFIELNEYYTFNEYKIPKLYSCFLALKKDVLYTDEIADIKDYIYKVNTTINQNDKNVFTKNTKEYPELFIEKILSNKGDEIPVSMLPIDGTYQTNTSQYNSALKNDELPVWNTDLCTQCGSCSMACPLSALRIKAYRNSDLKELPATFKQMDSKEFDLLKYTIQVNPEQCTGCNNCVDGCDVKAITISSMSEDDKLLEKTNWNIFNTIPEFERIKIDSFKVSQQQLQEPLLKYSIGVEGCGEAPYLKLISQLFGDRLIVANATGSSSIFGGALPTTPWSKNKNGKGPAWSNSLFEDNAEFGLGFRLSIDQQEYKAKELLNKLLNQLDNNIIADILNANQTTEKEIYEQEQRVNTLKTQLNNFKSIETNQLLEVIDALVKKSVWIVGGDGWAYDIGFSGIDHVIASGKNVNILVLDNEVYDNTGGQTSKSTPFGASGKLSFTGKQKQKKDLGRVAMTYDDVYVASVAIGANQEQTLKAFKEAESFDGPSIIIAYCHSDSHGINMKNPSQHHKAAVNSGQWLLYRNDPRRAEKNLNTLQLDSDAPSMKIQDYLKHEHRFSQLFKNDYEQFNIQIRQIQKLVDKRFDKYLAMSLSDIPHRAKLLQNDRIKKQLSYKK